MKLKQFYLSHRYGWALLLFVAFQLSYFLVQSLVSPIIIIHTALDDAIPFCEWFILPYVFWYVYEGGTLVYLLFRDRDEFLRLLIWLLTGMFFTLLLYVIFPTGIDFRPTTFERDTPLLRLTLFIYGNDLPAVVCPSIHCLNAIASHVALVRIARRRHWLWLSAASWVAVVLICLSTMFIKQHSVIDVAAAVVLSAGLYVWAYRLRWPFLHDNVS